MKFFVVLALFACLAFPVFSQNTGEERYQSLSDTMGTTVERGHSNIETYDEMLAEDGSGKTYTDYRRRYDSLSKALRESESRLEFLFRTNDRTADIKAERDYYESLVNQLESVKSDYDSWMSQR